MTEGAVGEIQYRAVADAPLAGAASPQPRVSSQQRDSADSASPPTRSNPTPARSVKAHRRARRTLITMAIAALVSAGAGAANAAAAAPEATATARVLAVGRIEASLVRIRVTAGKRSRSGGGVIIRSDGYVLISAELVSWTGRSPRIQVTLSDGRQAQARLVGIDDASDLAVLQVSAVGDLTAATFADTNTLTPQQGAAAPHAGIALLDLDGKIVGIATTPTTDQAAPADQAVRAAVELIASAS